MDRRSMLQQREQQILVDWVNSLPIDSCSVVKDVRDLRTGEAFADILCVLSDRNPLQVYRKAIDQRKALHNFRLVLQEVTHSLPDSLRFRPQEYYDNPQLLYSFTRWLISAFDPDFFIQLKESFAELYEEARVEPRPNTRIPASAEPPQPSVEAAFATKNGSLLDFFKEVHVLKSKATYEDVIDACATGVLYADLINALEGRSQAIQGINRNPKNQSGRASNILRALKYLRGLPKMNSRYLWSERELLEGDLTTIKGLIFDILSLYKRFPQVRNNLLMQTLSPRTFKADPLSEESLEPDMLHESSHHHVSSHAHPHSQPQAPPQAHPPPVKEQVELLPPQKQAATPETTTPDNREVVIDWLEKIGLKHLLLSNYHLTEDVARNGVLLCEIANLITRQRTVVVFLEPKTVQEAKANFESAFTVFRVKCPSVPAQFYAFAENIIKGDTGLVWAIVSYIMQDYPMLTAYCPEVNPKDLPYKPAQIEELKQSLLEWIKALGVLQGRQPQAIQELLVDLRSGVLLAEIVMKITEQPIQALFKAPKTASVALSNIKKALMPLTKHSRMSQKYVWNAEEVLKGNVGVIFGLLEDMHRLYDGLPPRKRGPNYHKDGPYLGNRLRKCASEVSKHKFKSLDMPSLHAGLEASRIHDSGFLSPQSCRKLLASQTPSMDLYKSTGVFKFSFYQ